MSKCLQRITAKWSFREKLDCRRQFTPPTSPALEFLYIRKWRVKVEMNKVELKCPFKNVNEVFTNSFFKHTPLTHDNGLAA